MDADRTVADALPMRVRLFAPWTWLCRRSKREMWGVGVVLLIGYVLSPGFVRYGMECARLTKTPFVAPLARLFIVPPVVLGRHFEFLHAIHSESWYVLRDTFGQPTAGDTTHLAEPGQILFDAQRNLRRETQQVRDQLQR